MDALLADAEASGTPIDGSDGLLAQITKSVLERALDVEIADQVEDMILSLYARGMSTRDITEHLGEVYGASVSAATISRVTDSWSTRSRPGSPARSIRYIRSCTSTRSGSRSATAAWWPTRPLTW